MEGTFPLHHREATGGNEVSNYRIVVCAHMGACVCVHVHCAWLAHIPLEGHAALHTARDSLDKSLDTAGQGWVC